MESEESGPGILDNEVAEDFLEELGDAGDHPEVAYDLIELTLQQVEHEWAVEGHAYAESCEAALAASEVVAAMLGAPSEQLSAELSEWAVDQPFDDGERARLREAALTTLEHCVEPGCELVDLMEMSPWFDDWEEHVENLRGRLER